MLLWYLSFVFRMYEREQFRLAKKSKRIELDQVYANQASLTKFESEINKRLRLVGKKDVYQQIYWAIYSGRERTTGELQ